MTSLVGTLADVRHDASARESVVPVSCGEAGLAEEWAGLVAARSFFSVFGESVNEIFSGSSSTEFLRFVFLQCSSAYFVLFLKRWNFLKRGTLQSLLLAETCLEYVNVRVRRGCQGDGSVSTSGCVNVMTLC